MTNNKWQFTNLELSKRLKELGCPQTSMFYWVEAIGIWDLYEGERDTVFGLLVTNNVSAYSCAELGKMLPHEALGDYLRIYKGKSDWSCAYGVEATQIATNEADARGLMLKYLILNKLITLP